MTKNKTNKDNIYDVPRDKKNPIREDKVIVVDCTMLALATLEKQKIELQTTGKKREAVEIKSDVNALELDEGMVLKASPTPIEAEIGD